MTRTFKDDSVLIVQSRRDLADTHVCHAIAQAYHNAAEEDGHIGERMDVPNEDIPYRLCRKA